MQPENTPSTGVNQDQAEPDGESDRRAFLDRCGRFAAVTPPAIAMLLSTSLTSNAIASSAGGRGRSGNQGVGGGVGGGQTGNRGIGSTGSNQGVGGGVGGGQTGNRGTGSTGSTSSNQGVGGGVGGGQTRSRGNGGG